ncbi:MAG: hypothetical protein V1794_05865 [Candidatus Glassbacteria bacterium]
MSRTRKDGTDKNRLQATKRFGEFLVEKGLIDEDQRDDALAIQEAVNHRLGFMATIEEVITVAQVFTILEEQKKNHRPFGELAREMKLLDREKLARLLDRQNGLRMKVGEILVGLMYLKKEEMETALEHFLKEVGE